MSQGIDLTLAEVHCAFGPPDLNAKFPPILGPDRCAEMLGISLSTAYLWIENGYLRGTHRRRGKRQLIWRDRAVRLTFNGSLDSKQSIGRSRIGQSGIGLTIKEINAAFANDVLSSRFGPILYAEQIAELLNLSRSTIYFWTQCGFF